MARSKEALLESTDPRWIAVRGMVRRMVVEETKDVLWKLTGYQLPDGAGGVFVECRKSEVFSGIGFYARAPSSGSPESIVLSVEGDADNPAIVATRDEKTRAAAVGDLAEGETAVYNDRAVIVVKRDGTVEIRLVDGTAIPLATKLDLQILRQAMDAAVIAVGAGGAKAIGVAADVAATAACATLTPPRVPGTPAWPIGTAQLKAQ